VANALTAIDAKPIGNDQYVKKAQEHWKGCCLKKLLRNILAAREVANKLPNLSLRFATSRTPAIKTVVIKTFLTNQPTYYSFKS
jgi:hypothetical protein